MCGIFYNPYLTDQHWKILIQKYELQLPFSSLIRTMLYIKWAVSTANKELNIFLILQQINFF